MWDDNRDESHEDRLLEWVLYWTSIFFALLPLLVVLIGNAREG